jgi:type IV secretory pathway VirB3-like protein
VLLLMVAGFLYLAHAFAIGGIATTPLAAVIALVVISDPVFCRLRITESATRD